MAAATLGLQAFVPRTADFEPVAFAEIGGWQEHDFLPAHAAFRRSCGEIIANGRAFSRDVRFGGTRQEWLPICDAASATRSQATARRFFETHFQPLLVRDPERSQGLFTGYYEPEVRGSRHRSTAYPVPLYARPVDLVAFDKAAERKTGLRYGRLLGRKPTAYFTRREIEQGALADRQLEIAWLASWADAFFMHIQGSGRVRLADGKVMRLAYAAKSGLPFTGVGGLLVERGDLGASSVSMQSIRDWMQRNPDEARELMWQNQSFVFFREVEVAETGLGPPGAQMVNLTPLRSLAVDRSFWAFGTPLWIDTRVAGGVGKPEQSFRQLMIAQDTGSAIKGRVRGDIFFGAGEEAAWKAGHLKSPGQMIALLPKPLAKRLLAGG
ncbi:MAG: murein transglycosylase A [Pseudomonadota bacterium]|nr:murein transglycosylase A [Pseudomonadota bacterium]